MFLVIYTAIMQFVWECFYVLTSPAVCTDDVLQPLFLFRYK